MYIDVNVHVSRWPFRRLPCDETPRLAAALKKANVREAWAGSFDALLHRDVAAVNARLAEDCRRYADLLVPFGTVNPTLPDWRDDLRRCHEEHRMPGIRLYPNYHGYGLDAPEFAELLSLAERRGLIVQIAVKMEDERTQHPLVQVPAVDTDPLQALLADRAGVKIVLLNALRTLTGERLARTAAAGEVYFDIGMREGVGGVASALELLPLERLLFGSHFPFFYHESAVLKLRESSLGDFREKAVAWKNAERLLARQRPR